MEMPKGIERPERGKAVARKTIVVSDLSGAEIPPGTGARVTIRFNDESKGGIVLDVTDEEAEELGRAGRRQVRRTRRPRAGRE